jgi:hypothetical protein
MPCDVEWCLSQPSSATRGTIFHKIRTSEPGTPWRTFRYRAREVPTGAKERIQRANKVCRRQDFGSCSSETLLPTCKHTRSYNPDDQHRPWCGRPGFHSRQKPVSAATWPECWVTDRSMELTRSLHAGQRSSMHGAFTSTSPIRFHGVVLSHRNTQIQRLGQR